MRSVIQHGSDGLVAVGPSPGPQAARGALAVQVADLSVLRRGAGAAAHRADAHALTLVTRGRGWHVVDFETRPCPAGTLLWVRPGQVQQYQSPGRLGGVQVRFALGPPWDGGELARVAESARGFTVRRLGSVEQAEIGGLLDGLAAEYGRLDAPHTREILAHLLLALLLRLDRLAFPPDAAAESDPDAALYARFQDELERSVTRTRRASDYAALLGCSVRDLTKACQGAAGLPVRDVIDDRLVLEAKRLLATTDEPLADLGRRLGLSGAIGLGRIFTPRAGVGPAAFRRRYR
jgi:AraC-like DNA-binding protein